MSNSLGTHIGARIAKRRSRGPVRDPRSQRGSLFVMFALMLIFLLTFIGVALEVAQFYNRRVELQNVADSVAVEAAKALEGTATGITNAVASAQSIAQGRKYNYGSEPIEWDDKAISFSAAATTPEAGWLDATAAKGSPASMLFVKIDTSKLKVATGSVATPLMGTMDEKFSSMVASGRAVAGRASIRVTPLAICALKITRKLELMNPNKAELLEFGFRRGIPYNLLNLNPEGTTPLHFVVDPIDAPGTTAAASNFTPSVVAPFVCTGTVPMARLPASFHVKYPFPAALVGKLNSRFDDYGGTLPCDPVSAPPDKNIKQFLYADAAMKWMVPAANRQIASSFTKTGALLTYAEIPSPPNPILTGDEYGLLWSFAKPVRFVDGAEFPKTQWSGLFFQTAPASNTNYPVLKTPYSLSYTSGKFFQAPSQVGELERRVLNIPLLNCTGLNSSATTAPVLGVGRFFMQVKASEESTNAATGTVTPAVINGEFAGLADEKALGTGTRLYQ